jgi:hypothetical protein
MKNESTEENSDFSSVTKKRNQRYNEEILPGKLK